MSQAALRDYNGAQISLLLAITRGESPPIQEIEGVAETFAMMALDRIRVNPDRPELVTVEVVDRVLLLLSLKQESIKN